MNVFEPIMTARGRGIMSRCVKRGIVRVMKSVGLRFTQNVLGSNL